MRKFRKATFEDLEMCWEVVDAARNQMIEIGRKQWTRLYPSMEILREDIGAGAAYVIEEDGLVVVYGAVYKNGEPEYERLQGEWLSYGDYLVVHRLAVCPEHERRGLAREFFAQVEKLAVSQGIHSVKVDTNFDNVGMLHILSTSGYTQCGAVIYPVSGHRFAFEKLV